MSKPPLPILLPPALRRGDVIAFISPSSRLNAVFPLRISRARSFLETEGFKVCEIYSPLPEDHRAAIRQGVQEIHAAFSDPAVRAILPTIGGHTLSALLPHLDYALIRANPKILLGFSDLTLLHHAIYAKAGLRTFYGPAAITQFGEFPRPLDDCWRSFWGMLVENKGRGSREGKDGKGGPREALQRRSLPPAKAWTQEFLDFAREAEPGFLRPRAMHHVAASPADPTRQRLLFPVPPADNEPAPLAPAKGPKRGRGKAAAAGESGGGRVLAHGPLHGGCLPSLVQLFGTPYTLALSLYAGCILLLEVPESPVSPADGYPLHMARKHLCDLRNSGLLDVVAGVAVGRPRGYGGGGAGEVGAKWAEWERMLREELGELGVPVLVNVSVGHTDPVLTVPLGAEVEIGVDREGRGWWRVIGSVVASRAD